MTLLPPPSLVDDSGPSRSLDSLGAAAVLGAMVKQRRETTANVRVPTEPSDILTEDDLEEDDESDTVATQKRQAIDPTCDAFLKIR